MTISSGKWRCSSFGCNHTDCELRLTFAATVVAAVAFGAPAIAAGVRCALASAIASGLALVGAIEVRQAAELGVIPIIALAIIVAAAVTLTLSWVGGLRTRGAQVALAVVSAWTTANILLSDRAAAPGFTADSAYLALTMSTLGLIAVIVLIPRTVRFIGAAKDWGSGASAVLGPPAVVTWPKVVALACAPLVSFVALLTSLPALPGLATDAGTGRELAAPAGGLAAALGFATAAALLSSPGVASGEGARIATPSLKIAVISISANATACALWLGAALSEASSLPTPTLILSAVAAGLGAVAARESTEANAVHLQAVRPSARVKAMTAAVGAAVGAGLFFATSVGAWDGEGPTPLATLLASSAITLVGSGALVGLTGLAIARSRATPALTDQPPWKNLLLDQLLYAGLFAVSLCGSSWFAAQASGGLSHTSSLLAYGTGLVAVASISTWALATNVRHVADQAEPPHPAKVAESASAQSLEPRYVDLVRLDELRSHVDFQARLTIGSFAVGALWLLYGAL